VSTSAAQAAAFFKEATTSASVWTVRDVEGFPAPSNGDGRRAMPFWSNASRAERVIDTVPAYLGFKVVPIPVQEWQERWLPGLERDGVLVGLNWSGGRAQGYDLEVVDVVDRLDAQRDAP
jgi:hypothetical protein